MAKQIFLNEMIKLLQLITPCILLTVTFNGVVGGISAVLALLYWINQIKRQAKEDFEGDIVAYFKNTFKIKNKK